MKDLRISEIKAQCTAVEGNCSKCPFSYHYKTTELHMCTLHRYDPIDWDIEDFAKSLDKSPLL